MKYANSRFNKGHRHYGRFPSATVSVLQRTQRGDRVLSDGPVMKSCRYFDRRIISLGWSGALGVRILIRIIDVSRTLLLVKWKIQFGGDSFGARWVTDGWLSSALARDEGGGEQKGKEEN